MFFVLSICLPNFGFAKAKDWGIIYNLTGSELTLSQQIFNKSQRLQIKIPANLIDEEQIDVKFKKLDKADYKIPEGYKAISNIYRYEIANVSDNFVLLGKIKLLLKHNSNTFNQKGFFYWDEDEKLWKELKSRIDENKNLAIAKTDIESLDVVVLEKISKLGIVEPNKKAGVSNPDLYSIGAVLMDVKSGKVMYCKDCDRKLTLASMTKIMTANVVLESGVDLNKIYTYQPWDNAEGQSVWLTSGDKIRIEDLLYTSLVKSANNATRALAHSTGMSDSEFAAKMNEKAKKVGADSCSFYDPTGLDWRNACTPKDYVKVAIDALKKFKIMQASTTKAYSYQTLGGKTISVTNTNVLLNTNLYILGGKTGYLPEIGMNLMTKARDKAGHEIISVAIGSSSYYGVTNDVETLLRWGFANWTW
ncbi:MAG: serine hydrolase [Patescibacteria group bacterium]|jgi:D-alanyl-D-alanine carboxypeptidase